MRYVIGALALIVSFAAVADTNSFTIRRAVVDLLEYNNDGGANVSFVDSPYRDQCGLKLHVLENAISPLAVATGTKAVVDARVEDKRLDRASGCEVLRVTLRQPEPEECPVQ